jgi:hypothetical protein
MEIAKERLHLHQQHITKTNQITSQGHYTMQMGNKFA